MSFLLKDPDAVLDYSIDWGADYLAAGELLAASGWSVVPDEAGGVTVGEEVKISIEAELILQKSEAAAA